jgi:hypothetical protein
VEILNLFSQGRHSFLRHEKQLPLILERSFETAKGVGWKFPRVKKPMIFRIQGEFRCGPSIDQEDVFGVTPNCAGYLTSE